MRSIGLAGAVFVVLVTALHPASADPCSLSALHWLKGAWHNEDGGAVTEERWTIAPGGRLMGSSWTLHGDRPGGVIEAETIQNEGSAVVLRLRHFDATLAHAREDKDIPMLFVAGDCGASTLVLDGQGTQAGERMTYRRDGDTLTFIGDFIHSGQKIHVEQASTRSGD
jgi:hypothetical protein